MKITIIVFSLILAATHSFAQNVEAVFQTGHNEFVNSTCFSHNGNFVVTGSADNTAILWDCKSGSCIRTFSANSSNIVSVEFSKDDKYVLVASIDANIVKYDVQTGMIIFTIKTKMENIQGAVYSLGGKYIITGDYRKKVNIYDAVTGSLVISSTKEYKSEIHSSFIHEELGYIAVHDKYDSTHILNIKTNDTIKSIKSDRPVSYSFSSDGKFLAIGSDKMFAQVFEIESGKEIGYYKVNENEHCIGCHTQVRFSSDGRFLVTAASKEGVGVWDYRRIKLIGSFFVDDDSYDYLNLTADSKYILCTQDDNAILYSVPQKKIVAELNNNKLECIPSVSPNGNYYVYGGPFNTAEIRDIESKSLVKRLEGTSNFNKKNGLGIHQGDWFFASMLESINMKASFDISNDGKYMALGKLDSVAIIISLADGRKIQTLTGHHKMVVNLSFSPDGRKIATCSADGTVKLWDVISGECLHTYNGHGSLVFDVSFSSDGKYLISGGWDTAMRIWDTETGEATLYIPLEGTSPIAVGFMWNDIYAISADISGGFSVWETDVAQKVKDFIGHRYRVNSFAISPNKNYLMSADKGGFVKEWDILTGMQINKYKTHSGSVFATAYYSDSILISAGADCKIIFWNKYTKKIEHELRGHSTSITGLKLSPDLSVLYSIDMAGQIKVWNLNSMSEQLSYFQVDRSNWLTKTANGYFDGTAKAMKSINYVSGLKVHPIDAFFEKYYAPNLFERVLGGEDFGVNNSINNEIRNVPAIKVALSNKNGRGADIEDTISWFNNKITLSINAKDDNTNLTEIRIYCNNKLVSVINNSEKNSSSTIATNTEVELIAGLNTISAIAVNTQRTESRPATLYVNYDGVVPESNLYILSIGVNDYENPSYKLTYATNDAKGYMKEMTNGSKLLFNTVNEVFLKDKNTGKENIVEAFVSIAEKATSQDVFVFYYAGHGTMNMQGEQDFYLIPFDVTQMYGNDEGLKEKGLSASELLNFSKKIKAQKQIYIIDACQSGAAVETFARRGLNREKAIAQLARSTGTYFLLASEAVQYASEAKELGHGLFTYALIEALSGKADGGTLDKKITANELKSYVEDRVPELSKMYLLPPQFPTGYSFGQDFPLVIVE